MEGKGNFHPVVIAPGKSSVLRETLTVQWGLDRTWRVKALGMKHLNPNPISQVGLTVGTKQNPCLSSCPARAQPTESLFLTVNQDLEEQLPPGEPARAKWSESIENECFI